MAYESITLKNELSISKIISIHYFEYRNDFTFDGESHNFWEFVCVDKGVVDIVADSGPHTLKAGQIAFHKPNEFHRLYANGQIAPNLVVMSFECDSPCMKYFENKILDINETEHTLLAQIIVEARQCFDGPMDDPYQEKLIRTSKSPFGAEQFIRLYLEQLLLHMISRYQTNAPNSPVLKSTKLSADVILYDRVINYLEEHIREQISIQEICHATLIGRTQLQKLFRDRHGCGVITYFLNSKISLSKKMIREHHMNFTQISEYLGYTSVHYFSRQFKKVTGMTPSEYAFSIKNKTERNQ